MFRNYLKTAFRSMRRHKGFSIINVLGLSVGLVTSFLILLWVQDELSYNQYPDDLDRIHRVMRTSYYGDGQVFTYSAITAKLDEVLDEEYPEIERAALVSWDQNMAFSVGDQVFRESGRHAGVDFFRIFSFPFLAGDRETALLDPNSVVLTEGMARKYFADIFDVHPNRNQAAEAVLGQVLRLDNRLDITVSGVIEDVPKNSSLQFDYVLPIEEFTRRNAWVDNWGNNGLRMYVKLAPGATTVGVSEKIKTVIQDNAEGSVSDLFLQPFSDLYLRAKFENGQLVGGRIEYVCIFAIVGIFILIIAAINFMNLATARSAQRALEIGVRKTFGGSRRSLAGQFLGESLLTAVIALVIAVLAVFLLLPGFNLITGKQIELNLLDPTLWLQFLGLTVVTGLLAGLYPAVYLSRISVINVLRKGNLTTSSGGRLRQGLVVFQFAMSIILIVGTVTVYNQIDYIRSKNLGLDRENLFFSRLEGEAQNRYASFRQQLLNYPEITSVATGSQNPLNVGTSTTGPEWDGKDPDDKTLYYIITTGHDYLQTMKMELSQGRDFSRSFGTDTSNVIVNETAVRAMGMDNPIGQRLSLWGREGQIIGVVKDFHMTSLYGAIEPLIIRLAPDETDVVYVRSASGQTEGALAAFEEVFRTFNPDYPYEYTFMDSDFEALYQSEIVIGTLANYFAVLAVFIACLGLFGLASFATARRTKEIGIRKVLGASVTSVVLLLSREFVKLVAIAFVIGAPIAYLLMNDWLEAFVYHTTLGYEIFLIAAVALLVITFGSVGFQSVRAARVNPSDSLRKE